MTCSYTAGNNDKTGDKNSTETCMCNDSGQKIRSTYKSFRSDYFKQL